MKNIELVFDRLSVDWTPEEDEAFNEVERQSNLGKQILKEIKPQREWVGLTDEEIEKMRHLIDWTADWSYKTFARAVEAKIKQKNGYAEEKNT